MKRLPVLFLLPALLLPQEPAPTIRTESTEVLVDVVVRDKRGRNIPNLAPTDITILEDGVPQTITTFREVRINSTELPRGAAPQPIPSSPGVRREVLDLPNQIRLVSLVFDRLGPDGRRIGRQAALDFLKRDAGPNVYYGVFAIDRGFQVLQPYTADAERIRLAVERATGGERSNFATDGQGVDAVLNSTRGSQGAAAATAAAAMAPGGPGAVDGASLSAEQAATIAKEMSDFADALNREDLGRMSIFSLWAIVNELKKLPGRKTALYFCEGLQLPNGMTEYFRSMISDANLANVTVYPIDARGLTTASDQGAANQRLAEAAQWSRYARNTETESAAANRQEFRTFDRAIDSIYLNQQQVMVELAESTGGFLIANTNDLRPNLQRLSEDLNTYYEISYRPKNQLPDGRFRAISVNVARKDAVVQARNGYFALPRMEGQTVYSYEAPLLRTLAQSPLPKELDFRSSVVRYRQQPDGLQQAALVFDLPLAGITFVKDDLIKKNKTHVSVLALIKDQDGRVVTKLSRDVQLQQPLDRLEGFKQGRMIVTRIASLQPGRYTVESVAADHQGNKVAARRSTLVITPREGKIGMSELALIRRLDKPAEVPDRLDPYHLPNAHIIPTLSDTVPGGPGKLLSLFFIMYPDASSTEPARLILDLIKDGQLLARSSPQLPQPDVSGTIPYVANTPLDQAKPGQYQFRATLIQGEAAAQKSIFVNVE